MTDTQEPKRVRVVVLHRSYGCDTGCCGHYVEFDDREFFDFDHPHGGDRREFAERFAKKAVLDAFGADHVADLEWEKCEISDD